MHPIRYVIVKVVRKDHLDQLPVPSRIKSYLNTPFYYSEQVMSRTGCIRVVKCGYLQVTGNEDSAEPSPGLEDVEETTEE